MGMYAGLTDNPEQRKNEHGNPSDWKHYGPFQNENQARNWEKDALAKGFQGGAGGKGWQYGYTYTITPSTKQ